MIRTIAIDKEKGLGLIKAELTQTLKQIESEVSSCLDDAREDFSEPLEGMLGHFRQLEGAFKLVLVDEASVLCADALVLLQELKQSLKQPDFSAAYLELVLSAIGQSAIILGYYVDFLMKREKTLPLLLIPVINEIRRVSGRVLMNESFFIDFPAHYKKDFIGLAQQNIPFQKENIVHLKRYRLMFQVGLLGVLKSGGEAYHFKMLSKSLERIASLCEGTAAASLMWLGHLVTQSFMDGGLRFTDSRKLVFSRLDRFLREMLQKDCVLEHLIPSDEMICEILALIGLTPAISEEVINCQKHFSLDFSLDDAELKAEYLKLIVPNEGVIDVAVGLLQEEISKAKEWIDLISRNESARETHLEEVLAFLDRLILMLNMFGLNDLSNLLKHELADLPKTTEGLLQIDTASLEVLADLFVLVDDVLVAFKRQGGQIVQLPAQRLSELRLSSSAAILTEAQTLVAKECRVLMAIIHRSFELFMQSDCNDFAHLQAIPDHIVWLIGVARFLEWDRVSTLLMDVHRYVQAVLSASVTVKRESLDILADVTVSIDHLFERMEAHKSIDLKSLELAEVSVRALDM